MWTSRGCPQSCEPRLSPHAVPHAIARPRLCCTDSLLFNVNGLFLLHRPRKVEVIHNRSVMGAIGSCGLQPGSFGKDVTIPAWDENGELDDVYNVIKANKAVSEQCSPEIHRPHKGRWVGAYDDAVVYEICGTLVAMGSKHKEWNI